MLAKSCACSDILRGPAERMPGADGVLVGVGFQDAVAAFQGAIVLRLADGEKSCATAASVNTC